MTSHLVDKSELHGEASELGSTAKACLLRHPVQVGTNGADTDEELLTDFSIRQSLGEKHDHLTLTRRELRHPTANANTYIGRVRVITREIHEDDSTELDTIAVSQGVLANSPHIYRRPVSTVEIQQQPLSVPKLELGVGTRDFGVIIQYQIIRLVSSDGHGMALQQVSLTCWPFKTCHGTIFAAPGTVSPARCG